MIKLIDSILKLVIGWRYKSRSIYLLSDVFKAYLNPYTRGVSYISAEGERTFHYDSSDYDKKW